jgi:cupin fold WbuC family metalloprotein
MNLSDFKPDPDAKSTSYYAQEDDLGVTMDLIEQLIAHGQNSRLCLHRGAEDGFHQMLILEYQGKSFPAHCHPNKSEGYHIIEGEMDLVLYTASGVEYRRITMTPDAPIARVGPNTFHKLSIISPYAVYHETKPGPFLRDSDKIIPEWA